MESILIIGADTLGNIDKKLYQFGFKKILHIKGRKKYLIVTPAGENVYPEDIEGQLNELEDIRDSVVLGIERGDRFEIHAVLLPEPDKKIHAQGIIHQVNQHLGVLSTRQDILYPLPYHVVRGLGADICEVITADNHKMPVTHAGIELDLLIAQRCV